MRKPLLLALIALPLLFSACKKGDGPAVALTGTTYYEQSPENGRSSITFYPNNTFIVKDLRVSSGPLPLEYKYKLKDGKMILTPPLFDSYSQPNPVYYKIENGELTIDNFRPHLWSGNVALLTFKKL